MLSAWPLALLLLAAPAAVRPSIAPLARVRAAAAATKWLDDIVARSSTARGLIERLAATDVIVYIEVTASAQVPTARTKLVTVTPSARFLRIGISSLLPPNQVPALIAHELQHAVEIAESPEVRDDQGVRRLYERIGRLDRVDRYETDAAVSIERAVRGELRSR
jgi:hypothetical protein